MNNSSLLKSNRNQFLNRVFKKKIVGWLFFLIALITAILYGVDKKLIVFIAFIISIFTEIFTGLGLLVAATPFIGPFLIKIVTIPIFWILNAVGYIVSAIAIKKGFTTELAKSRIITLALLIGIVIGYITGNIVPLK